MARKLISRPSPLRLPIVSSPHFAGLAGDSTSGIHYVMPVLLSISLVSLDNIQEHLENLFDQVGEDDVSINAVKFIARLELWKLSAL